MDSYLMMLYVTIEQESALKFFFVEQGWAFCKPDLSVTTDKLGPTTSVLPVVCEETEVFSGEIEPIPKLKVKIPAAKVSTKTAKRKGKRKSIKQTGRSTKLTKIMSSSLGTETNVTGVILDTDDVQNIHSGSAIAAALNAPFTQDELDIHSRSATDDALTFNAPFTVQFEDGNEMQIKVEKVAEDNESAVDDDGDDEDDTDLDYGYEGAVGGDSDVKSKGEVRADESVAKDDDCAPPKGTKLNIRRRVYDKIDLQMAFDATQKGMSVYKAARKYQVPETTLRDRARGRISVDTVRPGPEGLLSYKEEMQVAEHVLHMTDIGYHYRKVDIQHMAMDFANSLGKIVKSKKKLSNKWFYSFMKRWPDLKLVKPQKQLSVVSAKSASEENIRKYFHELSGIFSSNGFSKHPERIYYVDESVLSTESEIASCTDTTQQCVASPSSSYVTIIACGNALGNHVPPYYVYPDHQWADEFLEGAANGADGEIFTSGLSNTSIFTNYLMNHFVKYVSMSDHKTLVLYDGRKSHLQLTLGYWARMHNIMLCVSPPHSSHLTKSLGCGIFTPFKQFYNAECLSYKRQNPGISVNEYNVAGLSAKPYLKAMSPDNLLMAFSNAGVYPLNPAVVEHSQLAPATISLDESMDASELTKISNPSEDPVSEAREFVATMLQVSSSNITVGQ